MTPKEKAIELVGKLSMYFSENAPAKQCVLICVDEILDSHYKVHNGVKPSIYKYWQEVKQEINKL